jgi:hypothetical protein
MALCRIDGSWKIELVITSNRLYSRLISYMQAYFLFLNQCIGGINLVKCVCVRLDQKHDNGENGAVEVPLRVVLAGYMNWVTVN